MPVQPRPKRGSMNDATGISRNAGTARSSLFDSTTAPELTVTELPTNGIQPNPYQPRQYVDPDALVELTVSVRESGIHEPLIVRPLSDGSHQLVAGSRRLAAARAAGLKTVPVVIRDYSDEHAEQVALIENLQRSDLRFDDEANALLHLKQRHKLSSEALSKMISKSTDYVEYRIHAAERPLALAAYMAGLVRLNEMRSYSDTQLQTMLDGGDPYHTDQRSGEEAGARATKVRGTKPRPFWVSRLPRQLTPPQTEGERRELLDLRERIDELLEGSYG